MAKRDTLTAPAQQGYDAQSVGTPSNPFMWSSPNWYGYEAGAAMWLGHYTRPTKASMGRGYTVNVQTTANDFVVKFSTKPVLGPASIHRKG